MSIETIKTYSGYDRLTDRLKVTVSYMHRCTKCGTIKPSKHEMNKHDCKNELSTKTQTQT